MPTVIKGATFANPDKLNESELREALHFANGDLIAKDIQLHELRVQCHTLNAVLVNLCELTSGGKLKEAAEELDRLTVRYEQLKAARAGKVH